MSQTIIALDFTEHDTLAALDMLQGMAASGDIAGMVFAIQLSHSSKRARKVMLGATGRPANDILVAVGLTTVLQHNITRQAMAETA